MYGEAMLAFFVYLWYPKQNRFLRPLMARHGDEIDRNLLELRVKVGKIANIYWQMAASYGKARFFDTLQYVSSPSGSLHHSDQPDKSSSWRTSSEFKWPGYQRKPVQEIKCIFVPAAASELERIPFATLSSLEEENSNSCQQETMCPSDSRQMQNIPDFIKTSSSIYDVPIFALCQFYS